MKKLLLLLALLTFSAASFADGSVICEDRTETDSLEELAAAALEAGKCVNAEGAQIDCPEGSAAGSVISN